MTDRRSLFQATTRLVPALLLALVAGRVGAQQTLPPPRPVPQPAPAPAPLGLSDLIRLSLDHSPALRRAGFDVGVAQGRAIQAGLYPNPTVNTILDELGDRTGPGGVNTVPLVTQEIVTAKKLGLSRSVAEREVDRANLEFVRQRFTLYTTVRQGYFEVLTAQERVAVWKRLVDLAAVADARAQGLLKAGQIAELDRVVFQIELDRLRAEWAAAEREVVAAWRRLTSGMGVPDLPCTTLIGTVKAAIPDYDFDHARARLLEVYPEVRSARVGVEQAQLALRRAQVEPIPNVTVGAGYVRQNQNKSDDWTVQVAMPIPVFNRNQGNIRAAQAELGRALEEVRRVQYELINRLATAFGRYAAARERVIIYRQRIIGAADRSYELTLLRIKTSKELGDILLVLQAQKTLEEANLEYVRALSEAWQAASEIAGLLLEEHWPLSIVGPCEAQ